MLHATDNLNEPDASATVYDENNLKLSIKLTENNKNNQFYLKLVDEDGNEQIKQFTVDGGDIFDYHWTNLRKGESYRVLIKETDGKVEGPWYFVDGITTGFEQVFLLTLCKTPSGTISSETF